MKWNDKEEEEIGSYRVELVARIKNHTLVSANACFDPTTIQVFATTTTTQELKSSPTSAAAAVSSSSSSVIHSILLEHWKYATSSDMHRERFEEWNQWFDRLWTMHTESTRHYHTVVHLWEMIEYLKIVWDRDDCCTTMEQNYYKTILLSIFFHDAIYNVKSNTNEEDSASLFESFATEMAVPTILKNNVRDFILATKSHQIPTNDATNKMDQQSSKTLSSVCTLFLDLDMAVLGKIQSAYQSYATLIRAEYSFVPYNEYCSKRCCILETFLLQPQIFGTTVLHQALEDRARANIRQEIMSLRTQV